MKKQIERCEQYFDANMNPARRQFLKQTAAASLLMTQPFMASASGGMFSSSEVDTKENKIASNPLRFHGNRLDPVTKHYHLGNGTRMYNPQIMRFHAYDSMSPFGKGGLNGYAFCTGDPINRSDPSGHTVLIDRLIAGIIGAIIGAIVASIAEGIRCAVTGDSFNWKVVAIGAAVGFVTGALGPGAGLTLGMKMAVGFGMSVAAGLTDFTMRVAMGEDPRSAAVSGAITVAVTFVTFGLFQGGSHFLNNTATGQALSEKVKSLASSAKESIQGAASRFSDKISNGIPDVLTNHKPGLFEIEMIKYERANPFDAHIFRVSGAGDLLDELAQPGVHKFVMSSDGAINIGTINGVGPKTLSHPVLANHLDDVVSAGYMANVGDRVVITNHSGHFRPNFESLNPIAEQLSKLGVETVKVRAGTWNPAFLFLKGGKYV